MKSIIQNEKKCYVCRRPDVEEHHIFYGTANRRLSEKYGLKVWLCPMHHRSAVGVHFNQELNDKLRGIAEDRFNEEYPYNFQRLFYGDGIEVLNE